MHLPTKNGRLKCSLVITLFLSLVFVSAVGVWYLPALFKGYTPYTFNANTILARNFYLTGKYSLENDKNVLLAPDLIETEGQTSSEGNKFTSLFYGYLFKLTGLPSADNLVLLSAILYALSLLIFTVLILYLFDLKVAAIFSSIYILAPFNWQAAYGPANYEFGLLFLSLFFLLFFAANRADKKKQSYFYWIVGGIFLALTCVSVEALMLVVPCLFVWLWLKKQKRALFYIFIPFAILLAILWLPNLRHNSYLQMFFKEDSVETADYAVYGHLYPDPYTFHFEREEFLSGLKKQIEAGELDAVRAIDRLKELKNAGEGGLGVFDRMKVSFFIALRHFSRFVSLEEIGGPFILFLILLGFYALKKRNKYLYQFFIWWILATIFLMAFVVLVIRGHLGDFNWALTLLISLGALFLAELIVDRLDLSGKRKNLVYLFIFLAVLYHLVLIGHINWSRLYDNSQILKVAAYGPEVEEKNVASREVIAVNLDFNSACNLHYLTNKSMVYFAPETIKELLAGKKLKLAFEEFGIKYVLGYSPGLTEQIVNQTGIVSIADNSIEAMEPELSRSRGWLMNLVK